MKPEKIGFIGLGLIGGSIAKTIHRIHPDITLIAYDVNRESLSLALEEGVIAAACETLTDDPEVRKAVDDLLCGLYGMEMGGMS